VLDLKDVSKPYVLEARDRAYGVGIGPVQSSFSLACKVAELYISESRSRWLGSRRRSRPASLTACRSSSGGWMRSPSS
jgi:hypothetical protein